MSASKSPKHAADAILLLTVLALTLLGIIMIGSASSVVAERFRGDVFWYLKHQIYFGATLGLGAFLLGYFVPYRTWRAFALPGLALSLVLLVMVFVPGLRVAAGGSARWIGIGPVTLQPSELAKITFIMYLAALYDRKGHDVRDFKKSVLPFLIITGIISFLIVLQPDVGTLLTITGIAVTMIYAGGFRIRHLAMIALGGLAIFSVLVSTAKYRLARLTVFLHPELDPQGIGYQINQALLAVGTGGIWGLGFGRSRQKYQYLPEPAGDSIFAIINEELGLVRVLFLIAAYMLIGYRGYRIAQKTPDVFGRLMAVGITSWIVIQAFINMGSILALLPLTGIPLPFISYGGTALAALLFGVGILLNISKYTEES